MTTLEQLVLRARGLVEACGHRTVLGLCGSPGAGKSALAEQLLARLGAEAPGGLGANAVAHLPMDGFHLADAQLDRLELRHRKGAPETFDAHGYVAMLRRLRAETDHPVFAPGFERELEQPIAAALVVPETARLVITEGNYLLLPDLPWSEVRALVDEVWYVDLDPEVRLERLIARHVRFGKDPSAAREWVQSTDEPNARLIEAQRDRADLVVRLDG